MADISFSSINVDNGQQLGETPHVSIHSAGRNTVRAGDTLIVFFDMPSASEAALRDASKALSQSFWNAPGGVTTGLRLAMKVANDRLIELNRGVPADRKAEGSITCVVYGNGSLVVAQAGPALAYARSKSGAFEHILPLDAASIVGSTRNLVVSFAHYEPHEGDVYVITGAGSFSGVGASSAPLRDERLIETCMSRGDARMVAGFLNANVKQGRLMGVAVSVDAASPFAAPIAAAPQAAPSTRPMPMGATTPPVAQTQIRPAAATATTPRPEAKPQTGQTSTRTRALVGDVMKSTQKNISLATKSIQRGLTSFGGALLPTEDREALDRANENGRAITFVLLAIALLLPIIAAVVVSTWYLQFSGEVERQQLKKAAIDAVMVAESSPDASSVKANWPKALEAIARYEEKNPSDAGFGEAKAKARVQLDLLGKVQRVQPLLLSGLAAGQHRIAASAFGVYAISIGTGGNANGGQYLVVNPDRTKVEGKPYAMAPAAALANQPLLFSDAIWATTTGGRWRTEGAVVVGKQALFEYSSATGQLAPLPWPAEALTRVLQAQAGELYDSRVYLLDTGVGQIWRLHLSDTNPSDGLVRIDSYFSNPYDPLKRGIDIAIDGAIYVLQNNGAVLKYFNRAPQPLTLTGLQDPILQPVALTISGSDASAGSIFIADAGNGAVIEFSKAGQYVRQFRGDVDEFKGMHDITLDASTNTLYVATTDKLFAFRVQ
jgi:hypothetical protein